MLVEDDNSLREIYQARLLAEGYDIVTAKDGEEALALVGQEKPDLIILDVMMPKISGFDTLDIIRSTPATKDIKVVMMTALSQAEDKARAEKLGANKYLVKSQVTLEDIVKTVKEILGAQTATANATTDTPADPPAVPPTTTPSDPPVTPGTDPLVSTPADPPTSTPASDPPSTDPPAVPPTTTPSDPPVTPGTDPTLQSVQASPSITTDASSTMGALASQPAEEQASQPVTVMSAVPTPVDPSINQSATSLNSDGLPNISIDANGQVVSGAVSTDNATQNLVATPISTDPVATTSPTTITPTDTPASSTPDTTTTSSSDSTEGEGGTRVIQPINDPNADSAKLHQLLQEEQLREDQGKSNAGQVISPSDTNSIGDSSAPSPL